MDTTKAVKLAIANVKREGLTDIFPRPDEVDLLRNPLFETEVARHVEARIKGNSLSSLKVHPIQHVLFPKKDPFDFRRAALMQPIDTVTSLALVLSIADVLEQYRPPIGKKYVFSYRFKPKDGVLFNPRYNFTSFEQHVSERAKQARTKVLVKCDIASFYDRLNLHRLESTLLGLPLDKPRVKLINELLLFWANRDSYSIPVGGNGSRILAEAALLSVDDFLISNGIAFCRFVDDYRFFAPDTKSAHAWLTLFVERLFLEGLSINPAKTSLEDVSARRASPLPKAPSSAANERARRETDGTRLIVGYTGTVPTKFRELSEKEGIELREEDLQETIQAFKTKVVVHPDDIRRLLRMLVAKAAYAELSILPDVLDRFPQFTPMVVDLLAKKTDDIPEATRESLREYFIAKLTNVERVPEYILIAIVRLLGAKGYEYKASILDLFRNLKRNAGSFIGRCIIDALRGLASRNDVLEIRQYFNRADVWERRAIIRLVDAHLSEEEKRPWLKNVKVHMADDIFAIESFERKKK
ncbi:MAG: RNA-directed DNA polymerase [Candidatus Accumulibacter phosphatis]|nr:RNA-directed DNA polymerase [Candidatus Accumulibacter phosphatis]